MQRKIYNTALIANMFMLTLAGCGGGSSPGSNITSVSQPPSASYSMTMAEALEDLESSGEIPVLDRSATVKGTDNNSNGVRDDIDQIIDSSPDTSPQKSALRQASRAFSNAMVIGVSTDDQTQLRDVGQDMVSAVHCLYSVYDQDANDRLGDMRKLTVNTRQRYDAYMEYSKKMSGWSVRLPEGDTCENQ